MNGLVLIDKPEGLTSAEVVRRVKRRLGGKVGHLGTLDPFATGLLPLCLGEATKIAQFLNTADKRYAGVIQLGAATDTGDRTGQTVDRAPVPDLAHIDLAALAGRFTGERLQTPPMYSALKRDGVPLYRLARRGMTVERTPRPVRIDRLTLDPVGTDRLAFDVACSKGTYVRVLAEDIGAALGTPAHLAALRRTAFGAFRIDRAVPLARYEEPFSAAGPPRSAGPSADRADRRTRGRRGAAGQGLGAPRRPRQPRQRRRAGGAGRRGRRRGGPRRIRVAIRPRARHPLTFTSMIPCVSGEG
jgi:tRNA pseudouridine55 synthase